MTDQLLNAVKRHVASMIGQIGQTRIGTVVNVNVDDYTAKVMLQPEGILTGWLPVAAAMVGGGWGLVSPPSVGEQVVIEPQEGDPEHGIITGRIFSTKQPPPKTYTDQYAQGDTTPVQAGEIGLVHKDGTFLRLIGGKVLIHGDLYVDGLIRATKDITSDMNVIAAIDVEAAKDVTAGANVFDVHGTLDSVRAAYDAHRHASSGQAVPQVPE